MPRIVRFASHGGPEVLEVHEEPLEEPGEGEVRLKIEAILSTGPRHVPTAPDNLRSWQHFSAPHRAVREVGGVESDALGPRVSGLSPSRPAPEPFPLNSWIQWAIGSANSVMKYGLYGESAVVPAFCGSPAIPRGFRAVRRVRSGASTHTHGAGLAITPVGSSDATSCWHGRRAQARGVRRAADREEWPAPWSSRHAQSEEGAFSATVPGRSRHRPRGGPRVRVKEITAARFHRSPTTRWRRLHRRSGRGGAALWAHRQLRQSPHRADRHPRPADARQAALLQVPQPLRHDAPAGEARRLLCLRA